MNIFTSAIIAVIFGLLCLVTGFNWLFAIIATIASVLCVKFVREDV